MPHGPTAHDIDSAFKAIRKEESSSGRRKKKAVIEILNTICATFNTCECMTVMTLQAPVLKEKSTQ
jgi:hypothetical protein